MTVDQQFKQLGEDNIVIEAHTRDSCDADDLITINSTTDGDVELLPGRTRYFRIRRFDSYTKSGGWYWKCGNTPEKSRIKLASINNKVIKAVRAEGGVVDWYRVRRLS